MANYHAIPFHIRQEIDILTDIEIDESLFSEDNGMAREIDTYTTNSKGIWRTRYFDLDKPIDMVRYIARTRYAWPGGYELVGITDDCCLLCSGCIKENYYEVYTDTKEERNSGWRIIAMDSEAMLENDCCSHCNKSLGYTE